MEFVTKGREVKPLIWKLSIVIAFSFTGFFLSQFRTWQIHPGALKEEAKNKKKGKTRSSASASTNSSTETSPNTTTTTKPTATKNCSLNEKASLNLLDTNHESIPKIPGQEAQSTTEHEETSVEQEILQLNNVVVSLQERERSLEQKQEQENMIRELESKLKICKVETMIYNMKFETLKIDNQRLQSYEEDTKTKMRTLKKKLKEVEEENGVLAGLHRKVSILHEDKLRKLIDQENKAATLQKKNSELLSEKLELLKKLELALEKSSEAETVLKEVECLRLANEELSKDVEKLKSNSSKDSEELVYLRWVNACLRYELRSFNPSGKSAKDLTNHLSQESKDKAKTLILDYASSISDFDPEFLATGKATPSSEISAQKNKSKGPEFFNKVAKLMLGKKMHNHERIDGSTEAQRFSISSGSLEDILSSRGSYSKSSSSGSNTEAAQEVDAMDAVKRKKMESIAERRALESEKADLRRFADALNRSKALQMFSEKPSSFSN